MTYRNAVKDDHRFSIFTWLPCDSWRYFIILGLTLFIWLFYPLVFIIILVIFFLWYTA